MREREKIFYKIIFKRQRVGSGLSNIKSIIREIIKDSFKCLPTSHVIAEENQLNCFPIKYLYSLFCFVCFFARNSISETVQSMDPILSRDYIQYGGQEMI